MAEITAMLNLGQPDDQPSSHDSDFVEVASTCISKPKRQEICSPKQNRNHKHVCRNITSERYSYIITDTCPTPSRSPRKHCSSVLFTSSQSTDTTRCSRSQKEHSCISTPGPSTDTTRYSNSRKEPTCISTPSPSTDTRYSKSAKEPTCISTPDPSTDKWDGVCVNGQQFL
ncbi:unnamed protein product [Mytilus coruscus]|uniref:Uncharacterized protein n=1 Tax=Mytilus coruscus TaxID=42192 RepID=A0A6J8AID6_MYTCO|nr:unnamed protein product [Mytilus coruscus]